MNVNITVVKVNKNRDKIISFNKGKKKQVVTKRKVIINNTKTKK